LRRGEAKGRLRIEELAGPFSHHESDAARDLGRCACIDRETELVLAREAADQAIVLCEDRSSVERRPQQHAARADEALVGCQHDIALPHECRQLAAIEPPVVDAQPEIRTLALDRQPPPLELGAQRGIDAAGE